MITGSSLKRYYGGYMAHFKAALASQQYDRPCHDITCDRALFSSQLLNQWRDITPEELESTRYDRHQIAMLIERKEGVAASLIENYLRNLERTLPLFQTQ
jgi:hypothetical protein